MLAGLSSGNGQHDITMTDPFSLGRPLTSGETAIAERLAGADFLRVQLMRMSKTGIGYHFHARGMDQTTAIDLILKTAFDAARKVNPDSAELLKRAELLDLWAEADVKPEELFAKMEHTRNCERLRSAANHYRDRVDACPPQLLRHRGAVHQRNIALAISATAKRIFGVPLRGTASKLAALACGAVPIADEPRKVLPFKRSVSNKRPR